MSCKCCSHFIFDSILNALRNAGYILYMVTFNMVLCCNITEKWAGITQSVWRLDGLHGPVIESRRGRDFHVRPDGPWGPPSLLYNVHRVSFPGVKRPGRVVNHPPPSSAEVKGRVELYLYYSSRPS